MLKEIHNKKINVYQLHNNTHTHTHTHTPLSVTNNQLHVSALCSHLQAEHRIVIKEKTTSPISTPPPYQRITIILLFILIFAKVFIIRATLQNPENHCLLGSKQSAVLRDICLLLYVQS